MLGKKQSQKGFDITSLTEFLLGQKKAQQSEPDLTGTIGSLLGAGKGLGGAISVLGSLLRKK
jgi:hypothetical protein